MAHLRVNGTERVVEAVPDASLLGVLRDEVGLTGAKLGCGEVACGACTVLIDGSAARACRVQVADLGESSVTTVEGLAADGSLHAVQAAFVAGRALQCGFCTPGMVMSAVALLDRDPDPDEQSIRSALQGNICRCGGYPRIVAAVRAAARAAADPAVDAPTVAAKPAGAVGDAGPGHASRTSETAWTVVLPAAGDSTRAARGWGWSTPGGARLTIDASGRVRAFTGKVDGGQGNRIALRRLVAAELAAPIEAIAVEMGDTATAPYDLGTFGSRSVPDAGHALRVVAAAALRELLAAAGRCWGADPQELTAGQGRIADRAGRSLSYGELVTEPRTVIADSGAALPPAPAGLAAVDAAAAHGDLVAAVTGGKRFPSDLALPGMLHGRVVRPPAAGATLVSVDAGAAGRLPGVTVVVDDGFAGAAAPTSAAADAALAALRPRWTEGSPLPHQDDLEGHLRSHPLDGASGWGGAVEQQAGDVDAAWAGEGVRLSARYTTAYLAHVPMEPRAALAAPTADGVTVWVGTQRPFAVRAEVAAALAVPEDEIRIVVPDFGGGFGGKHTGEVAVEAALLARAVSRPVRVTWTREEEFRFGYLRPAAVIDVRSAAAADGTVTGWDFTNINSGAAGLFTPYAVPNRRERFVPADSPLRQGSYRALAATANHFARESHMDELALALSADPVQFRLSLLSDERLKDAVRVLADAVGWTGSAGRTGLPGRSGRAPAPGHGVGLACGVEKDARVASAAEVEVAADGALRVVRITTVFDCGAVVDPDGLRAQVVGATVMGLGGALFEAVEFDSAGITNASLSGYRVPRFPDVPPIDVIVLDRDDCPSAGAGETPIIAVAPAIANAVHAATGRRLRALPLAPHGQV